MEVLSCAKKSNMKRRLKIVYDSMAYTRTIDHSRHDEMSHADRRVSTL